MEKELLIEKYRPNVFRDFISGDNNKFVEYIKTIIIKDPFKLPNLILYGSAGCGKTTLANIIIKELDADFLYIDASFNNGVDTIRGIVNEFSRTKAYNLDSPKIIFLDESDRLSPAAQDALKNIIEARNKQCRFIFSCNTISRMTEPLKSRCNVCEMVGSDIKDIKVRLEYIIKNENLKVTNDEIDSLIERYYPDIRSMIKSLDSIKFLNEISNKNKQIVEIFNKLLDDITYQKEFTKLIYDRTLNHRALLIEMFNSLCENDKIYYAECFAEADYRMAVGSTPEIQMVQFVNTILKK